MNLVDSFIKAYLAALREDNAAIFAGAGLSIPVALVDWQALLRDIANDSIQRTAGVTSFQRSEGDGRFVPFRSATRESCGLRPDR